MVSEDSRSKIPVRIGLRTESVVRVRAVHTVARETVKLRERRANFGSL